MRSSAVFCLLSLAALAARAQDDPVQKETLRLQGLSEREKASIVQESTRHAEWKRQQDARLASMRQEISRMRRETDSLKALASRAPATRPTAPVVRAASGSRAEAERKAFAAELATLIETSVLPRLESELSPELHRRPLQELVRGLRGGSVSPEDGIGALFDQLSELVEEGGRMRTEPGTYKSAAGMAVRGSYVHAGGVLDAFANGTGTFAAIRRRGEAGWTEVSDPATRQALARAARVMDGSDKGLVALPLGALR